MIALPPLSFVKTETGQLAFLCDNSSLESLVCPRLYELKHIRKRELVAARAGRNFGSGLHIGWRERYVRCGSKAVDDAAAVGINTAMAEYFAEKPQPPDDFRTLDHAQRVMAAYNDRYRDEPFTIMLKADGTPAIESSFAFPLGEVQYTGLQPDLWNKWIKIIYTGRIDLLSHDAEGDWAGPDHKTAFQFGDSFLDTMSTDSGQKGYCWAFQQFYGRPPRGYIIDAVRIRRPTKASSYAGGAPCDASDMQRIPHYVFPGEIDEWREDTLAKIETIFWMHARGYFQRHTKMCVSKYGRCDMFDVCTSARDSRETVLVSNLFEEATWSPLNPTTKQPDVLAPVKAVINVMVNPPKI